GLHGDPRVRALQVVPGLRLRGQLPELGVLHGGAVRHCDRYLCGLVALPAPAGAESEDGLWRDTGGVAAESWGAPRELAARRFPPLPEAEDGARPSIRLDHDTTIEARGARGVQPSVAPDRVPRGHAARVRVLLGRRQRGRRNLDLGLARVARAVPPVRGRGRAQASDGAVRARGTGRV